jgi:hypothetical protein
MQIVLTEEESREYFFSALCNGGNVFRGYGLQLDYNSQHYQTSKDHWILKHKGESICFEDVLMQMLKDGYELKVNDIEGDGEMNRTITLKTVYERMPKVPAEDLLNMKNEQDDSSTADVILQTVFFESIIFG